MSGFRLSKRIAPSVLFGGSESLVDILGGSGAGSSGSVGPTGPSNTGPTGPSGPVGNTGPTGAPGSATNTGATGETGPAGPTGETGPQGIPGSATNTGATGETGPTGDIGPQGPPGPPGPQGDTGDVGSSGPQGDIGPTGAPGTAANTGATGPTGPSEVRWHTIHVETNGNDGTADGTPMLPYLTIQAANTSILDNASGNEYVIAVGPGIFNGVFTLKPYVFIEGFGENATIIQGGGDITLDPSWAGQMGVQAGMSDMSVQIGGFINFDLTPFGGSSSSNAVVLDHVFAGDVKFTGTTTNDNFKYANSNFGTLLVTNCNPSVINTLSGILEADSTIPGMFALFLTCFGSLFTLKASGAGTLSGVFGLSHQGGSFTIDGAGVTAVTVVAGGLPPESNIVYLNGATSAVINRLSDGFGEGFTPQLPANWNIPVPNNVARALDQIAARLALAGF